MRKRKRNRMFGYDYSRDNLYFVTICVQDMKCEFGDIISHEGSPEGSAREGSARELTESKSANEGSARELTVTRNQNHKKMILNSKGEIAEQQWFWLGNQYPYVVLHAFVVMPNHIHGILEIDSGKVEEGSMKIKPLSELMGAFKTTSSKLIHLSGYKEFKWHRSFHDHIIRSKMAYKNISKYIETNPLRWENLSK